MMPAAAVLVKHLNIHKVSSSEPHTALKGLEKHGIQTSQSTDTLLANALISLHFKLIIRIHQNYSYQ